MPENLGLAKEGTTITSSTSFDPQHPPLAIIDGNESTFWSSTGLFPQEFVMKLRGSAKIERIRTLTTGIKKLIIEASDGAALSWDKVLEIELPDNGDRIQVESLQTPKLIASYLKFKIMDGYSNFVTFQKVSLEGRAFTDKPHRGTIEKPPGRKRGNSF